MEERFTLSTQNPSPDNVSEAHMGYTKKEEKKKTEVERLDCLVPVSQQCSSQSICPLPHNKN
eukprot:scaffold4017_cov180-Amphora_coffeaeformis.AAC.6